MNQKLLILFVGILSCFNVLNAKAAVSDIQVGGWFEGGYVTWTKVAGLSYNVYVSPASGETWTKLDTELVREYPTYGRADALGLKAGQYKFKVVPVSNNVEQTADATVSSAFTATAHNRGGYAHFKTACSTFNPANGIGAYKNDGTLKSGAKVFYVTADNAKSISTTVQTGSKAANITTCTGIQSIIDAYQKGYDKTPIDFRIIGTIKKENLDHISSSAEGLQIKGKGAYSELNITIEGVGKDATIHGFGFLLRNACSVELRNFAIMWCMDDAVSMDTDNSNLWIHNLDLFYGKPGGAADQKKGDGTLDIKGDSKYSTLSYNHLWDSGKASLCGMTSESGPNYLTYHHNWFDHSDSRHPRIRTMSVHVYNNYYDGNSKYGVGSTTGSDVFVENNYFRNCKYPMLTSKQGSDVHNGVGSSDDTKGTFSGEAGGSIKAYGNYMTGQKSFEPYKEGDAVYSKHFDAYVVQSKSDKVPNTVVSLLGGNGYSNFDTDASLMYSDYTADKAEDVPGIVTGQLGAGRCQHGDFTWTFGANEDANDQVIAALSTAINNYKSTLVGFFGQSISNGGSSTEQGGSSDEGTPGSSDDSEDSGDDNNDKDYSGNYVVYFPCESKTVSSSDAALVQISGNPKTGISVSYNGKTYTTALKMESSTSAVISPSADATVTLVFDSPSTKLKIDGTAYKTDANGQYTFQAKKGTKYTLTKGETMNLVAVSFDFGEGQGGSSDPSDDPNPGTDPVNPGDTDGSTVLINYPVSGNGVTAKGTTTNDNTVLTIKNGYVGGSGDSKTVGNGILLKVDGGFLPGDIITVAGKITVKTSDEKYATKILTTAKLATINPDNNEETIEVYKYGNMVNTVESPASPADQSFTLTESYPELWLVRDGGTSLMLTKITVVRPSSPATGIFSLENNIAYPSFGMYDLSGRQIFAPLKGQIYIQNGKKYIGK